MNRGWGPYQRRGSNPWWAFGTLARPCTKASQTLHKAIALCTKASRHTLSPFQTIIGVKVGVLCFSVSLWEKVDDAGFPTDSRYLITPLHFTCLHKKEQVFSSADKSVKSLFFLQPHLSPFDIWYSAIRISLAFAQGPILGVVFVIKGNSAIKLEGFILWRSYCLILCIYEKGSIKERIYMSLKTYYIWPFFATRQNNFLLADCITCRDSVYHCTIKLLQAFWFCSCSC